MKSLVELIEAIVKIKVVAAVVGVIDCCMSGQRAEVGVWVGRKG